MPKIKVLVIGAGLGGLCLAQALRDADVEVQVFDRDASPWDRPQGYRLHLEADGLNALREVLPPGLHRLFEATAMRTLPFTTILSTDLSVVKQIPTDDGQDPQHWPDFQTEEKLHDNVDRATLRQILLSGLENICHFGKSLTHYESRPDGITATFADGTSEEADILVGADGIRSAVRQQRAPQAQTMDAGVQAIYGRVPFQRAAKLVPSQALEDIFAIASDARKVFLGLGAVKFPARPDIAAGQIPEHTRLMKKDDYVVCIVGGRHEHFPQDDKGLRETPSEDLQRIAAGMLKGWPREAASIIANGDPSSFFIVSMYTSVPCELSPPTNVTVLGDAIHAMTPTLGRGANLAMRDAALLSRQLKAVAEDRTSVPQAMAAYETEMLSYGFGVVRESVIIGQQRMGQNPLPD